MLHCVSRAENLTFSVFALILNLNKPKISLMVPFWAVVQVFINKSFVKLFELLMFFQ